MKEEILSRGKGMLPLVPLRGGGGGEGSAKLYKIARNAKNIRLPYVQYNGRHAVTVYFFRLKQLCPIFLPCGDISNHWRCRRVKLVPT
jgi:hypothetical protein